MTKAKEDIPVILDIPGVTIRSTNWGGIAANHIALAKGSDFSPALKGLPGDMCSCPHWGYILKGALTVRYSDGREETAKAGDLWFGEPGHTAWCDEETEFVEFSPADEYSAIVSHVRKTVGV